MSKKLSYRIDHTQPKHGSGVYDFDFGNIAFGDPLEQRRKKTKQRKDPDHKKKQGRWG